MRRLSVRRSRSDAGRLSEREVCPRVHSVSLRPPFPLSYLNDGRQYPTRVRQPERDEQVDVNLVAQAPQFPGNEWQRESSLQYIYDSTRMFPLLNDDNLRATFRSPGLVSRTSSNTDRTICRHCLRHEGAGDPRVSLGSRALIRKVSEEWQEIQRKKKE